MSSASSSTPVKPLLTSLTAIDTPDSSSVAAKYGDSDLASKRRKPSDNYLVDYESFKEVLHDTESSPSLSDCSDFKGGLLKDYNPPSANASKTTNTSNSSINPAYVSPAPSENSCGFANTFDVLQDQITRTRSRHKSYLNRISEEYCPSFSSFMHDSINLSRLKYNEDNDEPLTFFELQYEAAERLKEKRAKMKEATSGSPNVTRGDGAGKRLNSNEQAGAVGKDGKKDKIETPLNELLYNFHTLGLDVTAEMESGVGSDKSVDSNETIVNESGEYPECVYHMNKGNDGRLYLRVVNNILVSVDEVLCGNRVSQMTRAYDDIEAVTRLLEEKEKDLELTVQIGKELLTQNGRLEKRIVDLEVELKKSNEERAQLAHDLHQKSELIAVLTNDIDEGQENETPTSSKSINLDLLQRKIASLQDENKSLKREAHQLAKQTDEVEEQERKLMEDITSQLNSTNNQFDGLNLELERQKEENRLQHEQILNLQARLAEAEMRLHQLTAENDEQVSLLSITKENQNMLAAELAEFKERYQEVLALLQETQEQLRKQKKKSQPQVRSSFLTGLAAPQPDSLHSELMESSLYSDNSLDSGISADRMSGNLPPFKKVFETVRCAVKNGHYSDGMSHLGAMSLSSSSQPRMSAMPYIPPSMTATAGNYHRSSSVYSGSTYPSYDSSSLGIKTMSCESLTSTQSDDGYPSQPAGIPGAPGAKDLEAALKRLTPAEVLVRRTMLAHAPAGTYTYDENPQQAPLGFRTPDSIMSTGSSSASGALGHGQSSQWRLPERLQIVKPMEGSQTLHHWSRLAQPNLSGLLEERPGVTVRGGRGLEELGMQMYTLSDVEEDIDDNPGKQFQPSGCIYTYTNSMVMHPDDGTAALLGLSVASSKIASNSTSRQSTCPPTPPSGMSRRNSCSTYSVNMGLASLLNERGIKAITPSAMNTPAGPNYSPTVTPCNSPEGSPTRSQSPEPMFGILSSGADLIRRKLLGEVERPHRSHPKQQKIMLSRLEKRALRSLRLLEKVESVGLENIIGSQPNAMSQLSSGIASRSVSPMAQLTSLKNLSSSSSSLATGCGGLHKGISNDSLKSFIDSDLPSSLQSSDIDSDDSMHTPPITTTTKKDGLNAGASASSSSQIVPNPVDIRVKQMQRQKSRRNLKNGMGGQRHDLGTVGGRVRPDLGRVDSKASMKKPGTAAQQSQQQQQQQRNEDKVVTQSMTQSFVGSISSLFFGRKGGWL